MSKIEETLWKNYKEVNDLIDGVDISSKECSILLEERDRIRNGITIGTFVITSGISIYAISKTFKFDQVGTITSTLGRNILSGVVPKLGKK